MAQDLFTNIAILISFLSIAGQVFKNYSLEKDAPLKIRIMIGGIFALMGITLMFFTIKATDIVIFDLRNLAIICAGIFGGPIAVIISALGIGIFRVAYFGINIASIVAFSVAIITGLGLVYISKSSYKRLNKFILMFLLSMIFSTMALIYLLMDAPHLMEILRYYWLIYVLGGIIAYYTCEYIMLNNKTFKEMSYYQIMADNLLDMITIYTAEGMYSYASPSSKQLLGKDPKEIIGKDALHLIHPDDLAKITEIQAGFKMDEFREYTQELRLRDQDGQYIWTESTFKSIKDIDGNLKEIICATRDISERKAIEKRLREQREEAIEANRLKSQFLANMSHELRTPLNSIIGFTTRVIKKSKDDLSPIQLENLEIVKEEGQHLLALINDLLDYSKIEAGKMDVNIEAFNLDTVIDEAFSMTKGLMEEKEIQFEKVIKSNSELQIVSDRIKMKQILVNLLSNAFKYSDQGKVTLSIGKIDKCYNISVCDEGIGIEKGQLENIFDEFHQIDGSYTRKVGGTGLGLAITKRFVEMMGGRIHVESTIDVGSCFTIMMPGIDGFEVCRLLKESSETKNIPIIMVTAKTEGEDLKKAFHLGAFDYIKKPIDELEVLARLNSALMFSQQQKKLESMAMKDGLTDLYNHKLSIELFEKEFIKARRHHKSIAFLMLDIDYFKNINDSYGHRVGDEILREVGDIIKKNSRVSDIIGRYGGEEFCITLVDISIEEAELVCERIRQAIDSNTFTIKEHSIHITLSIGNCFKYPENPCGYEEVIIQADKALYQAKRLGKNRSETYILENNNG